ncbi:MAG: radical SAM protein [Campylobacterota bacterium]
MDYNEKLQNNLAKTLYRYLPQKLKEKFMQFALNNKLSFQNTNKAVTMIKDLYQWDEAFELNPSTTMQKLQTIYTQKQNSHKTYTKAFAVKPQTIKTKRIAKESLGFGMCPVASPKTRCCNLLTLDVVESCGFDCSYCSIQSFYNENKVTFNTNLKNNLKQLQHQLDPNQIYHIGTGQSSDSLMWGDKEKNLTHLNDFAKANPNIILELKTKSDNIAFFLENEIAKNIIITWSLNPQTIIDNEEHKTASLKKRVAAAQKLHDRDILVGFHFHPMIEYNNWQRDYTAIAQQLLKDFDPQKVAMVSLGTLTFIKPVIKKIRQRDFNTKILQMPFEDANAKLSYPKEIKLEMFQTLYNALQPWHEKVFFYLCMEDHSLWKEVFNKEYSTNESFELDMKLHYRSKIAQLH